MIFGPILSFLDPLQYNPFPLNHRPEGYIAATTLGKLTWTESSGQILIARESESDTDRHSIIILFFFFSFPGFNPDRHTHIPPRWP